MPKPCESPIPLRLRTLMKETGLTYDTISKRTGYDRQQLHRVCSGRTKNPGILTVKRIVEEGLGRQMSDLFSP